MYAYASSVPLHFENCFEKFNLSGSCVMKNWNAHLLPRQHYLSHYSRYTYMYIHVCSTCIHTR